MGKKNQTNINLLSDHQNSEVRSNKINQHLSSKMKDISTASVNTGAHFADSEEMDKGIGRIMKDNGFK